MSSSAHVSTATGANATAAALSFGTPPPPIDIASLRAQLRREVLGEVRREAATALHEVERASRENARIVECAEYAAPRFVSNRLNAARQSLLNILSVSDSDTTNDDEEADAIAANDSLARWTDPEQSDMDALEINY